MNNRLKDFLTGLTKLTNETEIIIDGCGCCDSPFLELFNDTPIGGCLSFNSITKEYEINEY